MSLREKIVGNELDLSLNQLTEVPVKELAAVNKATHLDLSCNRIQTLPNDFSSLTHLLKIDLSKNRLVELPSNFGNLLNLQYLDLYGNQISNLPVSFCRLKNLRWLDLKNNPLEEKLKRVAGDCLDEKECQVCAKKVVSYMQSIESDNEREKQKKLKAVREKEAVERAKHERQLEEQRRIKKLEKEKRKAESRARREAQVQEEELHRKPYTENKQELADHGKMSGTKGISCAKIFMYTFSAICFLFLAYTFLWVIYMGKAATVTEFLLAIERCQIYMVMYWHATVTEFLLAIERCQIYMAMYWHDLLKLYVPQLKDYFLKIVHRYMSNLTYYVSQIEQILALYF